MVTLTSATNVKNEIQNYDTTLSDAIINVFIENAEGLICATAGEDVTDWYSGTPPTHKILRLCATKLALIDVIKWDLQNQFGTSVGSIQLDLAKRSADKCLMLLADKRIIKFIKGETH